MRNTEYKYKPFRVPASVLSPKQTKDSPSHPGHPQILSNQEERHLQKKVQELVWFFQNGNMPKHTKKSASGSIKTTPLRQQNPTLTPAFSASSLEECASRKQMNSLRAAIKSQTPARNQREPQPLLLNTKSNEQLSVNSGHHSSRQTTKRSVGSMSQINPFNKTATHIYSGISKLALESRNKSSSTSTQISYKSSPYSSKPQRPAVHHYSLNKAEEPPSLLMPQQLSSANDEQYSKIQPKRKSTNKLRGNAHSQNKTTAATEESPVQKRMKKKSSENLLSSAPSYGGTTLSKKRNSETRIGIHQPPKQRNFLQKKKSHQHNITYDQSQLKEATKLWEPKIYDASKEDRCTPIKPRLPSSKKSKQNLKLDMKTRDESVKSGSNKASQSPKRSQMLHFAFFKDHSSVKYGSVQIDDNSIQHPSKAFKSFVKSMANEPKLSPRTSVASYEQQIQTSGRNVNAGIASDRTHSKFSEKSGLLTKQQKSLGNTKPQLKPQFLEDFEIFGNRTSARASGDYFNPHPRSPYKNEIEKAFKAQLSDRVPANNEGLTAREFRIKPAPQEEVKTQQSMLASRNYLPSFSPQKLLSSPLSEQGVKDSKKIDATPATAVGQDSSFERCIQDTPPPIKGRLYGDEEADSTELKKPRPFSYFGNKAGGNNPKQLRGHPIGETIQESAAESEITLLGSVNQSARNNEGNNRNVETGIFTPRKNSAPKHNQDTPKASLSTDEQSFTHNGDEELFQKVKLLAKNISPSKYEDSPVQPPRYRERSLLETEALKFPKPPQRELDFNGQLWNGSNQTQKLRGVSSSPERVNNLLSSRELQVEVALMKKEKQTQIKKLGQDKSKRYNQEYQSRASENQDELSGNTAEFAKYEEPLESDRVVWQQIQNVKIEEEDKDGSITNSIKDLHTFRGQIKKLSEEGEDSDTTERIQRLSFLVEQGDEKTGRISKFKEVREKMLNNLGNVRLFNNLREEGAVLIQNQYRKHRERKTTSSKLKELKMLIQMANEKKWDKPTHINSMSELPFQNVEIQTEKVPQLELFKWIRGKGGDKKKEKARRVAIYAIALAMLSMKRMMGE